MGDAWLPKRVKKRIEDSKRVYIACSGGADSIFLTLLFAAKESKDRVTVLHFNHRLRGADSDGDERFVRELCSSLELRFLSSSWKRSDKRESVSEEAARDARMDFFFRSIGKDSEDAIILTGHHADDVAETLLMRISRGSGLQGLCAPREISQGAAGLCFVRPLLKWRKGEILNRLLEANAIWREDDSNLTEQFFRNRLRKNVIPAWEAAADRPVAMGAAMSRELLEEDWIALEQLFDHLWHEIEIEEGVLDWNLLEEAPLAIQRRSLIRLVSTCTGSTLTHAAIEGVLESIHSRSSFKTSVEHGQWIEGVPSRWIRISETEAVIDWEPQNLPEGVEMHFPGGGKAVLREVEVNDELLGKIRSGTFSHEKCVYLALEAKQTRPLRVRTWQPGDAYRPMGRESAVKLKELFIDRKIPRKERRISPIVTGSEGEILWVPGLPPNKAYRLTANTTRALQLTYEK